MKKAIGYIRVSTAGQRDEGVSLKDQAEKIKDYCKFKDIELINIVADEGVSAGIPLKERDGGKELLNRVDNKEVDVIVSVKLDRLFRDAVDCLQNTKDWDNEGIALHLLDLGGNTLDTSTATGRMFLTISAGFAEMERNLTKERTKAALQYKKNKKEVYSPTPTGYDRKEDKLEKNEEELDTIRLIKQLREEGYSYKEIANKLNKLGLKTKTGKKFYSASIHYIVNNDLYEDIKPSYVRFKEDMKESTKEQTIKLIKQLREQQGLSYNKIAKRLNSKGIDTFGKSKKWYSASVSYIVKNNSYYDNLEM